MLTSKKKVCMGKDHLLYQTSCESCTNPGFPFLSFSPFLLLESAHLSIEQQLSWAASDGRADPVKLLLSHPAIDVNVKSGREQTPCLSCVGGAEHQW